jgi:uncharacterized protein YkwD
MIAGAPFVNFLDCGQQERMRMAVVVPDLPKVEQHIVEMTNQVRREKKLSTLKVNAMLAKAARAYAQRLARTGQFSHTADGRNPGQRAESAGYHFCAIAENLAMDRSNSGFDTGQLALQAIAGWMNSPPHRANILMASATEIGVGVARAPGATAKFISVEMFGRPATDAIKFEIVNLSGANVSYAFEGKTHDLKPRLSITQSTCTPGEIAFSKSAGFFSAATEIARMPAQNEKRYTLKAGANGTVTIDIGSRTKSK